MRRTCSVARDSEGDRVDVGERISRAKFAEAARVFAECQNFTGCIGDNSPKLLANRGQLPRAGWKRPRFRCRLEDGSWAAGNDRTFSLQRPPNRHEHFVDFRSRDVWL